MTMNHIDQLAEWWNNAEKGEPRAGDTLIWRKHGPSYELFTAVATDDGLGKHIRILARAPRSRYPFPAILATYRDERGMVSGVWRPEGKPGYWEGPEGDVVHEDSLEAVTPLIEAKVTDEARDRVWDELVYHGLIDPQKHRPSQGWAADVVHATLGLETACPPCIAPY